MILTYTRVAADGFDQFLEDEESVLALTTELQLSTQDLAALAQQQEQLDPSSLLPVLEGRWSGEESTFSLERSWGHLAHLISFLHTKDLSGLTNGGRATHIYSEYGPLRVFTPSQTSLLHKALQKLQLDELQKHSSLQELIEQQVPPLKDTWEKETQEELWTLYPALQRFFELAAQEGEFVILAMS